MTLWVLWRSVPSDGGKGFKYLGIQKNESPILEYRTGYTNIAILFQILYFPVPQVRLWLIVLYGNVSLLTGVRGFVTSENSRIKISILNVAGVILIFWNFRDWLDAFWLILMSLLCHLGLGILAPLNIEKSPLSQFWGKYLFIDWFFKVFKVLILVKELP